jgi:hypothetical protein
MSQPPDSQQIYPKIGNPMNYTLGTAAAAEIAQVARKQATAEFADALAFVVAREQAAAAEQRLEMKALLEDMRAQRDFWKRSAETNKLLTAPRRSLWQWLRPTPGQFSRQAIEGAVTSA